MAPHRGLTLVEMLIAMSITLLMMAAVVTVFSNVSGSINRRRATIEMAGELRNAREILSRDLENATCPTLPPRRPEANEGYLEIIEGPQNDYYPSVWLYDSPTDDDFGAPDGLGNGSRDNWPRIDLSLSFLPGSNLRGAGVGGDEEGRGVAIGSDGDTDANDDLSESFPTDGRGLGDGDDILMLTVRNENQPFVGRIPHRNARGPRFPGDATSDPALRPFPEWGQRVGTVFQGGDEEFESPLAEVVWYAVENPPERDNQQTFAFGEPGFRTVYRRTLLIAPWLEYRIPVGSEVTGPGVVRVLSPTAVPQNQVARAIASLVAFQERYDLSVRLEWDPILGSSTGTPGRWVLKANSLADLTKRENRYEHHGMLLVASNVAERRFPFAAVSAGANYAGGEDVRFIRDREYESLGGVTEPSFETVVDNERVVAYEPANGDEVDDILAEDRRYRIRPFAYVQLETGVPATARAILNEDGSVVRVVRGFAPLARHVRTDGSVEDRRGEDVVLTDALAFDLKVYDPGAPLYGYYRNGDLTQRADVLVDPNDPAWPFAYYFDTLRDNPVGNGVPQPSNTYPFRYERQGAYVDLGYRLAYFQPAFPSRVASQFRRQQLPPWLPNSLLAAPSFFEAGWLPTPAGDVLSPEYSVYDTWSWHYENNGINEDGDVLRVAGQPDVPMVDEGANGFDDRDPRFRNDGTPLVASVSNPADDTVDDLAVLGIDDPGERETRPPYPVALRGLQATLRAYERDSLQIREVKVRESFVPE